MTWPNDTLATTHFDSGTDSPASARSVLETLITIVKAMVAARGSKEGVASLNAQGIVPIGQLPSLFKPGDIKVHAGAVVESGWLLADGNAFSRAKYADLFAVIGTTWGDGDGRTTFNLPNYTDRFILGASSTRAVGTTGGAETHTLTEDELAAHEHATVIAGGTSKSLNIGRPYIVESGSTYSLRGSAIAPTTALGRTTVTGGGQPHNNMPPFAVALVIIKT